MHFMHYIWGFSNVWWAIVFVLLFFVFVLFQFYSTESLSRVILSQFKNIFLTKKNALRDAQRHWRDIRGIRTENQNKTNRQQKRRQHTNKSEAKINGFKLNIFIRSSTEKYDTVNRMRFTFRVQLVIFRSSHRIGGSTAHTIGHSNWKITLFHRVFKLNDIHTNILIWR